MGVSYTEKRMLVNPELHVCSLGMISPVLLSAKRVMQMTWQMKLQWDETIPEELLKGWKKWKIELVHHN